MEKKADPKKEEINNHKKKNIYNNIEMQKTLIYNNKVPIYKQHYYSYIIDANDDRKNNKNDNKAKYVYNKTNNEYIYSSNNILKNLNPNIENNILKKNTYNFPRKKLIPIINLFF